MTPLRFSLPLTILLALLVIPTLLYATDVSGPVSGTWTLAGSPYNVVRQIVIPENQTLTIEPGVQVIFQGWYKLTVYGQLQAIGTESNHITFTPIDTTIGWHGIRFINTDSQADSSRLIYCRLTYGRSSWISGAGEDKNGGVIYCLNSSKVRILYCLLANNKTASITGLTGQTGNPGTSGENVITGAGGAVYLSNSSIYISNSFFAGNHTGNAYGGMGGYGNSATGSSPHGSNGGIGGNAVSGNGGAIYCIDGSPIIVENQFIDNSTGVVWGGTGGSGGYAQITQGNGSAYGGDGENAGTAQSGHGGVIYISNGSPDIAQNIFRGNRTGNSSGGKGGDGGSASAAYWAYANSTYGGDAGNGSWGNAGMGGVIYLSSPSWQCTNNLFFDYNRTGYGRGGDGGEGGWGQMFGSYTSHWGGDGGNGADGHGGNGGLIYLASGNGSLGSSTASINLSGFGYRGLGGYGGFAQQNGEDGLPGIGVDGLGLINNQSQFPLRIINSILWNNGGISIQGRSHAVYSCIEGGYPGIGNISDDPLFVDPINGDFHLQSTNASYHWGHWLPDPHHSPCIDAGYPLSSYENEPIPNGGRINMGFEGNTIEASLSAVDMAITGQEVTTFRFHLYQNSPNPFNLSTKISFELPVQSTVNLTVYDIAGRSVLNRQLETLQPGYHEISFDGSRLASGIYIYRLTAGEFTQTQKMTLLK